MAVAGEQFNLILPILNSLLFLSSIDTVLSVNGSLFSFFSKFKSMLHIKLCVSTMSKFSHTLTEDHLEL